MPDRKASGADINPQLLPRRAHKSALGFACGILAGGGLFLLTALHVALKIDGLPLGLLAQYFAGYDVSWRGAFVGLAWAFGVGFIGGWLVGFVHNFTVSVWMFGIRIRHDLEQTSNFIDHV
jgi:hypothetical protein